MDVAPRIASLLLPVWLGCGVEIGDPMVQPSTDDGKGDGAGEPQALTATEFFARIGDQFCDECFRCQATYPAGQAAFAQEFGATEQQCRQDALAFYSPQLVEQSIAAGRIIYRADAAEDCADGIDYEQSCNQFWNEEPDVPSICGAVFVGTVVDGGACVTDYDCASTVSLCDAVTKRCVR
jgi:hypothetical protein